jgi:hypothetical protein
MTADNDDFPTEPRTVSVPIDQARALLAAGELLTAMWGDLCAGDRLTLGEINARMDEYGLSAETDDGVPVIADTLQSAVIDLSVLIDRSDADEVPAFWCLDLACEPDRTDYVLAPAEREAISKLWRDAYPGAGSILPIDDALEEDGSGAQARYAGPPMIFSPDAKTKAAITAAMSEPGQLIVMPERSIYATADADIAAAEARFSSS